MQVFKVVKLFLKHPVYVEPTLNTVYTVPNDIPHNIIKQTFVSLCRCAVVTPSVTQPQRSHRPTRNSGLEIHAHNHENTQYLPQYTDTKRERI
jgi:hypothetical protein